MLYNQMVEDAVHFLSKDTVVQAIARSATKVLSLFIKLPSFNFIHPYNNWSYIVEIAPRCRVVVFL